MFTINVLHVLEKKIIYVWGEEFLLNNAGCHDITLWTGWLKQGFPDGANGKNLYLLHCGQTLYHLSHQGSPNEALFDPKGEIMLLLLFSH